MHRPQRVATAVIISIGLAAWALCGPADVPAAPSQTLQISLEPQELSEPLETYTLQCVARSQAFAKEPDLAAHRVVRGAFGFGGATNEYTGFLWDHTANRLYLDLNGNGDLADDSGSPFAGEYEGFMQLFRRLKLNLRGSSGKSAYLVDLRLGSGAPGQFQCTVAVRSVWQGHLELGGRTWQIGLAANPLAGPGAKPQYFLFRPWEVRNEPLRLNPGTPYLADWSEKMFLAGQAFSVSANYTNQDGALHYWLSLTPAQASLGRLQVRGQFLYRLILKDASGYEAILDSTFDDEPVPAGSYQNAEVWLRHETGEAFYMGALPVHIRANERLTLVAGGPLTNTVTAQRRGEDLVMTYRLTGLRGLEYKLSDNRTNPPSCRILAGDKELALGKFAYG